MGASVKSKSKSGAGAAAGSRNKSIPRSRLLKVFRAAGIKVFLGARIKGISWAWNIQLLSSVTLKVKNNAGVRLVTFG